MKGYMQSKQNKTKQNYFCFFMKDIPFDHPKFFYDSAAGETIKNIFSDPCSDRYCFVRLIM